MIVQTLQYSVPDGKQFISFNDWVATLSPERQAAAAAVIAQQEAFMEQKRASGVFLGYSSNAIQWSDTATEEDKQPLQAWRDLRIEYYTATGVSMNMTSASHP